MSPSKEVSALLELEKIKRQKEKLVRRRLLELQEAQRQADRQGKELQKIKDTGSTLVLRMNIEGLERLEDEILQHGNVDFMADNPPSKKGRDLSEESNKILGLLRKDKSMKATALTTTLYPDLSANSNRFIEMTRLIQRKLSYLRKQI